MASKESLFHQHPDYKVALGPERFAARAEVNGVQVAASDRAVELHESKHAPVIYFPLDALAETYFQRTEHSTFCPFKGEASYWSIVSGGETLENAAWSYEDPFPEVDEIRGLVAFYGDKVNVIRG
ncbi:MAG: DUF427 domain-containing protein [Gammaproteobacteria bacterium]|nr:DUF427 domain-containing protein [Gammaproteobacteria bacterium]